MATTPLPPQVQNLVDKLDLLGFEQDPGQDRPDASTWSDGQLSGSVRWDPNEAWLVPTNDPGQRLFVTGAVLRSVPDLMDALEQAVARAKLARKMK